jgi:hypothetical protein
MLYNLTEIFFFIVLSILELVQRHYRGAGAFKEKEKTLRKKVFSRSNKKNRLGPARYMEKKILI